MFVLFVHGALEPNSTGCRLWTVTTAVLAGLLGLVDIFLSFLSRNMEKMG